MTINNRRGPAPVDTGWSWVVMAAVMLSTFLEMGLYKSFGIFFVEFVKKFGSSATMTSVISGVYLAGYSLMALIVMTYGLSRISCRQSVMIGGVFISIGYLMSSLATTIEVVILAQGVFTGFLRDLTGSYVVTFHVMGSCALIGGSVLLLLPLAKRYEDRKLEKTNIPQRFALI